MQYPNFTIQPQGRPAIPAVEPPSAIKDFLDLFEVYCVVACCDWDALDFSEAHVREILRTGKVTKQRLVDLVNHLSHWSEALSGPCLMKGSDWFWDPTRARQELSELGNRVRAETTMP